MTSIIEELICPNKNCGDGSYSVYIKDYLIPSIYKETTFNEMLKELPQLATFLLGKTLFNSLNVIIESYRKYKNYEHLSNIDSEHSKNFKYLLTQNKKIFNYSLEQIEDQIVSRRVVFDNVILYAETLLTIQDPIDKDLQYIINDHSEMKNRLTYIIEMIKTNKNTFENSVISYKSGFIPVPIA